MIDLRVYLYTECMQSLGKPEEGTASCGTGVTFVWELCSEPNLGPLEERKLL